MREFSSIAKQAVRFVDHNSASILTGISVIGVVTTAVFAVRATPEALRLIKEEDWARETEEVSGNGTPALPLTKFEVVKVAWKPYIPAALMGTATIAAIIGSRTIDSKRNAALAAAYSLTDRAYHEYREKTTETLGAKKEEEMRGALNAERSDRAKDEAKGNSEVIIVGNGDVLVFDTLSGRHFMSDVESIRKAVNDINQMINNDMYASLTDFYLKIGVGKTSMSDELGWNNDAHLEVGFSGFLTADNKPAIALDYMVQPKPDYWKLW